MDIYGIIVLILGVSGVFPQGQEPEFLDTDANVTAKVGHNAVLTCRIRNLGVGVVIWRYINARVPLTVGGDVFIPDRRLSVERIFHRHNEQEFRLHIQNVTMKDSRQYECRTKTKSKTINLEVIGIPERHSPRPNKIEDMTISGPEFVDATSDFTLECRVTGFADSSSIDWFRDDIRILGSFRTSIKQINTVEDGTYTHVSELTIFNANKYDAGTYVCRAAAGQIRSMRVRVLNTKLTTSEPVSSATFPPSEPTSTYTTRRYTQTTPESSRDNVDNEKLKAIRYEYYRERIMTDKKRRIVLDLEETYYRLAIKHLQKQESAANGTQTLVMMNP